MHLWMPPSEKSSYMGKWGEWWRGDQLNPSSSKGLEWEGAKASPCPQQSEIRDSWALGSNWATRARPWPQVYKWSPLLAHLLRETMLRLFLISWWGHNNVMPRRPTQHWVWCSWDPCPISIPPPKENLYEVTRAVRNVKNPTWNSTPKTETAFLHVTPTHCSSPPDQPSASSHNSWAKATPAATHKDKPPSPSRFSA